MAVSRQPQLLQALAKACLNSSHNKAASAICALCEQDDAIRQRVLEVGGLLQLVNMLCSECLPAAIQAHAAQVLCAGHVSSKRGEFAVIGSEELHVLIDQLNSSSSDFQQAASTAIAALCCCTASSIVCQRVPEISQMHVNALGPLASLLSSPLVNCQQQALLAIWGICKQDSSGPQELFTSGGMQPLMSFFTFSPDTHACQEQAATILACMCSSSPDARQQLAERTGVQLLIQLLASRSSSVTCQQVAVHALAEVCSSHLTARQQVVSLNGMEPLICLLGSSIVSCQEQAVRALADICSMMPDS